MSKNSSKKQEIKTILDNLPANLKGLFEISDETKEALEFIPENLKLKIIKDLSPIKLTRENVRVTITNLLFKSENELRKMVEDKENIPVYFKLFAAMIARAANGDTQTGSWLLNNAIGEQKTEGGDFYGDEERETIVVLKDPKKWSDDEIVEKQKKLIGSNLKAYEDLREDDE